MLHWQYIKRARICSKAPLLHSSPYLKIHRATKQRPLNEMSLSQDMGMISDLLHHAAISRLKRQELTENMHSQEHAQALVDGLHTVRIHILISFVLAAYLFLSGSWPTHELIFTDVWQYTYSSRLLLDTWICPSILVSSGPRLMMLSMS
jgi:hypothetical protein